MNPSARHPDDILTIQDLADELPVSIHTLYKWSRRGWPDFPRCTRLANRVIIVIRRDLDAWIAERAS